MAVLLTVVLLTVVLLTVLDRRNGPDPPGSAGARAPMSARAGSAWTRPSGVAADQLSTDLRSDDSPSMVRPSTATEVSARLTVILRAFAFSATGMLTVSTPSW